jgi:hypothetical protein
VVAFSSPIEGVPTLDGSSDSSSITKAFSNSDGSGPRAVFTSLSLGFGFLGLEEGESVLEVGLLDVDADRETAVPVELEDF